MDEKLFLAQLDVKMRLLMAKITDKRPLLEIYTMIQDREMDEKQFLEVLQQKIDKATAQIAIHPGLEDISEDITGRLRELNETEV